MLLMKLVPKREHLILLLGDVAVFALSLWLTLSLRSLEIPSWQFLQLHLAPFSILFAVWIGVFFLAGLYGRHTRLFRSRLFATLVYTQIINILIAALFF